MIPESLTIQGIYSYREAVTIDFKKLLEGRLFGIFGAVGSGKSTLLEAITFALYGETERLNRREARNYNMMNLRSNELLVDFEFRVGKEAYKFKVKGRRNKNQFEDVKIDRAAYQMVNGEWKPLESLSAEPILGLSYENFRRTVIIPQGKFQEFLQLTDKQRTDMMKELFSLQQYELQQPTQSLYYENDKKKTSINSKLEGFGSEITEKGVKEGKAELEKLDGKVKIQEEKLKKKQDKFRQLENQKVQAEELAQKEKAFEEKQKEEPEIQRSRSLLRKREKCEKVFQPLLEKFQELNHRVEEAQKGLEQAEKKQKEVVGNLKKAETDWEVFQKEWQNRDKMEKEGNDLKQAASLFQVEKDKKEKEERLEKGKPAVTKAKEEFEEVKNSLQKQEEELRSLKKEAPDQKELTHVREWLFRDQELRSQWKDQDASRKKLEIQRESLSEKLSQTLSPLKEVFPDKIPDAPEIPTAMALLSSIRKSLQEEEKQLREKERKATTQGELMRLRSELEEGKPCPLCGATEHPDVMDPEHVEKDLQQIHSALEKGEQHEEKLNEAERRLNELKGSAEYQDEQLKEALERKNSLEQQLKDHQEQCPWKDENGQVPDQLKESLEKAEKVQQEVTQKEKAVQELRDRLEEKRETHLKYKEEVQKIEQEIGNLSTRMEALKEGFQILAPEKLERKPAEQLKQEAQQKIEYAQSLQTQYEEKNKYLNELKEEQSGLKERINSLSKELEKLGKEKKEKDQDLEQALEASEFTEIAQVKEVLGMDFNVENTRQKIQDFEREYYLLEKRIAELKKAIGEKGFDMEGFEKEKEKLEEMANAHQELRDNRTKWKREVEERTKDLQKKKELKEQLQKVEKREQNLKVLMKLFRGSGFVNFVSGVYLQDLVRAANERFHKITGQQLWLETTEDNEIKVRDLVHDGQVRHVKTLSGGQTFQASLCLALSLAESVRRRSGMEEQFFFLDEGFGTLDKESLSTVFETLRSLRKEGRLVGVISHVEDLQESIDVHLKVENDPEKGSQVEASWE